MDNNMNSSKVSVEVGNPYDGDGKTFFKFNLSANKEKTQQEIDSLKVLSNGQIDTENSVIITVDTQKNQDEFVEKLTKFLEDPTTIFPHKGDKIKEKINQGGIKFKHCQCNGKLFLSFTSEIFEQMGLQPI